MCALKEALSPVNIKTIKDICQSYNNNAGNLINILHRVQEEFGYLPIEVQEAVARELSISVAKIYGVVSFYTFFTMKPKGKYPISVCLGTACYVRGSEPILEELKKTLAINVGETTPDGFFSLDSLRCVGACGLAPVVIVGEKVYGRVEVHDIGKILSEYK
ncbi:MAG: NAD(P)H-dependent oxidoreductase subunit E [Prevotellaceae bacterium]|jgi:NADH-quinone oxidoreductase subunit E/NADP-reducing hydrogenase subunit HndA|nr:NAD(P)H-dependent oxidoreductase subunit E [Prevotellaceae bacterium]